MGRESNLKVNVEEYTACAADINALCQNMDSIMTSLLQHLQTASTTGIQAGETAESFSAFVSEIARLEGNLKTFGTAVQSLITGFLDSVDDADDLLFTNQGYKPFTDEEFQACFAVVENTEAPSIETSGIKFWFSALMDKLRKLIWRVDEIKTTVNMDSSVLAKNVDNLKEETASKITSIKANVRTADRTYQHNLKAELDVLQTYKKALAQIDSILSYSRGVTTGVGLTVLGSYVGQLYDPARKSGYTAGGGGYSSGGGGKGSFGGSAGVSRNFERHEDTGNMVVDAWNDYTYGAKIVDEKYHQLDENEQKVLKELGKEFLGKELYYAIDITHDISTGDVTWDTAKSFLKAVRAKSATVNVIIESCKTVTKPTGTMKTLMDGYDIFLEQAADNFSKGNIGQGIADAGMSTACGLSSIVYGVGEVSTELISSALDDFSEGIVSAVDTVGNIIPGETGMVLEDLANGIETISDSVTGFISDLLQ